MVLKRRLHRYTAGDDEFRERALSAARRACRSQMRSYVARDGQLDDPFIVSIAMELADPNNEPVQ